MEIQDFKPKDPTDTPDVEGATAVKEKPAEKPTKRKAKAKSTTAKSKRRKRPARTVAPPPPLTIEELKEQGVQAKQEVINAVVEPAVAVVGSLSQTIRDTISGAFAGLLSRKRRDD